MRVRSARSISRLLRLAAFAFVATSITHSALSQAAAAGATGPALSRFDLYGGYAYFHPFGSDIHNVNYPTLPVGAVGSVTGYLGRTFGLQIEGNYTPNSSNDDDCVYTAQAGPILRWQKGRVVPFFHALGGAAIVGGPVAQKCNVWGWGVTGGGGLDVILPVFHDHFAVRPIQADFMYSRVDNGPASANGYTGGLGEIYAFRASAGLVFRLGNMAGTLPDTTFNCSAEPPNPYPGDQLTLTASTLNLNLKRKPQYLWSVSSGAKVASEGPTASVDTSNLSPGPYAVTGKVVEGSKQRLIATCSTSFTVKGYDPPTVACSADKSAINSGDPVAITATARSPQNRPLRYGYKTTNGVIVGEGPSVQLTTVGVTPGNITVTCNVADDKGHTASASASVVVATPVPPPPRPTVRNLCGVTFDRDLKRPDRVDNEAKGCLDDVALTLNRESADRLLIIGSHAANETDRNAAERAMNVAQYLTDEKGVDPTRLDLRVGPDRSRSVAMLLVPPGAVVDAPATGFDTKSVKRSGQPYGKPRATPAPHKATTYRRNKRRRVVRPSARQYPRVAISSTAGSSAVRTGKREALRGGPLVCASSRSKLRQSNLLQ